MKLRELQSFITNAVEMYGSTEKQLVKEAESIGDRKGKEEANWWDSIRNTGAEIASMVEEAAKPIIKTSESDAIEGLSNIDLEAINAYAEGIEDAIISDVTFTASDKLGITGKAPKGHELEYWQAQDLAQTEMTVISAWTAAVGAKATLSSGTAALAEGGINVFADGATAGAALVTGLSMGVGLAASINAKNAHENLELAKAEAEADHATKVTGEGAPVDNSSASTRLKATKLSSEKIELDWLPDKYTAVEVKGSVKVAGKEVDVSRRVYQIEIDKNYVPKDPSAGGLTNKELMAKGNAPYVVKGGVESKVELHHLIQKEPGGMVEIAETTHDNYSSTLHGLVEDGNSFRNDPELEKQYNNFRSNYWKMRANEE